MLVAKKLKLEHEAKLQQSWMRDGGNRLSSSLAAAALLEVKPESEATRARKAKEAVIDSLADAIAALMDDASPEQPASSTVIQKPKPVFGFKLGVVKENRQ